MKTAYIERVLDIIDDIINAELIAIAPELLPDINTLKKERDVLLARIAEIDTILKKEVH